VTAASAARQSGLLRTLNALHLCVLYTPRLWQQADVDFGRSLPPVALAAVRAQVAAASAVLQGFEGALTDGVGQLCSILMPKLRPRLDAISSTSFLLETDAAFAAAKAEGPLSGVAVELEAAMVSLRGTLVDAPREETLQALLRACAERIEAELLRRRFDHYGALLLDGELRALTKRAAELSTTSVRARLARLTQMAALLNVESLSEAAELWADGAWLLSPSDARAVLALRVGFSRDAIAALALPDAPRP